MTQLTKRDIEILGGLCVRDNYAITCAMGNVQNGNFNTEDVSLLIDALSDEFSLSGLGEDDEPNEYGLEVEAAIDRLAIIARAFPEKDD